MVCIDSEHGKAGHKFATAWVGPGIPQARNAKRLMACQLYGFIVLQPNGVEMHIWAAWLDSSNPDDLSFGLEFAKSIAKQGNCKKVTFSSMRSGWETRAKQLGFRPRNWELSI